MKEEILKRAMFAMPLSKDSKNTGIMAGFEDEMDDMEMQDEMQDEMLPMERSPQNPEILMNTLRGDMRSMDARYMELAQMVGEEAAMDTPPEVLAMLQDHFAMMQQPQGGIGGLPQGEAMMPPPMPGDPAAMQGAPMPMSPEQMPMGGAPMPMDQGQMMPPGGEGMQPPFPQGAEQAPQNFAIGGLAQGAVRLGQAAGPLIARGAQSANAALGRMFMSPQMSQPVLENVRGAGVPMYWEQIARGGNFMQPTLTQGLNQGLNQLATQYPNAAPVLSSAAAMLAGFGESETGQNDPSGSNVLGYDVPVFAPKSGAGAGRGFIDESYYANRVNNSMDPTRGREAMFADMAAAEAPAEAPAELAADTTAAQELARATGSDLVIKDIKSPAAKSKIDRIRQSRDEYSPLFQELMGDSKDDMKTNALLMLADAGFKFAGDAKSPTMAMAFANAVSGVPKGFAAMISQAKDRKIKLDSAALTQAIEDVNAQDTFAKEQQMKILEGDYKILVAQAKLKGGKVLDGGMGGRISEDNNGSYLGFEIDKTDPTVTSAIGSPYTLRSTDNPFVQKLGVAPTTVETDKVERIKLGTSLRSLDNALQEVFAIKSQFEELYSPGSWVSSQVNNIFVPLSGGLIRPDVDQAKAASTVLGSFNRLAKSIASANETGRVAVQTQEWSQQTMEGIKDPEAFFKNRELAAGELNAQEARLRNARQQVLTQLGYEGSNYVMSASNTGTQNDPFVIAQDPDAQRRMYTFLKGTVGMAQDPNATVYLRMPNGAVQAISAGALRGMDLSGYKAQ